jgi:predicted DCC family thiol-disulfide oxidoreductase YuxK
MTGATLQDKEHDQQQWTARNHAANIAEVHVVCSQPGTASASAAQVVCLSRGKASPPWQMAQRVNALLRQTGDAALSLSADTQYHWKSSIGKMRNYSA